MKKIIALLMSLLMVGVMAGCGSPEAEQPEEQIDYEIALVTDSGMIMDGGYSQVAWTTISDFGSREGISHKYYKAAEASETAYMEAISNAVDKGAKVIIADGYSFEDVVYNAQKEYPDVNFILIDAEPVDGESGETRTGDNTAVVSFASEQAGYLAGYSAVKDGNRQLGFMGDSKTPSQMDYCYGFMQGADDAAAEDGVSVNVRYHYGTDDEDRTALVDMAAGWYESGVQVVFACGSEVEQPVIEAAELSDGRKVIAAETDKSQMSDTVMTSAVKDISGVLENLLERYNDDEFPGGTVEYYDAENEGIWLEMENARFARFTDEQYETVLGRLVDGSVTVSKYNSGDIASLGLTRVTVSEQ